MKSTNYKHNYPDGITTSFWNTFVNPAVIRSKGNMCENCGSKDNLDIHHTDMNKIDITTLKVLCRKCHKKEHQKGGKYKDI